jgi:malate/lactate dehydrogenase
MIGVVPTTNLEGQSFVLLASVVDITDVHYAMLCYRYDRPSIVACKGVRAAFLVGGMPRRPGMTRQDLLSANAYVIPSPSTLLTPLVYCCLLC